MEKTILIHNGKELHPIRIDAQTYLLVPKERATKQTIDEFKRKMAESRELATYKSYNH